MKAGAAIIGLILVVVIGYYSWRLERYVHYKWSYQSMVQTQVEKDIAPLKQQVATLEQRVAVLEQEQSTNHIK